MIIGERTELIAKMQTDGEVMTPAELRVLFRVDSKTPGRWAREGKIPSFKTPGGHNRFRSEVVRVFWQERGSAAA